MRALLLAATLMASVARADDAPLVVAKLATRDDRAHVVDAVCALRVDGVDVSLDARRCAFTATAFRVGRTKVAIIPDGVRVTF